MGSNLTNDLGWQQPLQLLHLTPISDHAVGDVSGEEHSTDDELRDCVLDGVGLDDFTPVHDSSLGWCLSL